MGTVFNINWAFTGNLKPQPVFCADLLSEVSGKGLLRPDADLWVQDGGKASLAPQSLSSLPTSQTKAASFSDNAACVRSERSGNVRGDLLCVTNVNPKPYRSRYICFGFVRSTEGRGVHSMVKGQTTCHISLPSLATTEGCIQRKGWY